MIDFEVLIPAYNSEDCIAGAVRSAYKLEQVPACVRVYVDGSSDRTGDVARRAGATDVIVGDVNRGVGAARQILLERAQSEYVCFLDADDELLAHAPSVWESALARHPNCSVHAGSWEELGSSSLTGALGTAEVTLGFSDFLSGNPVTSSAALIRRQCLVDVRGYDPDSRRLVDYDVWLRMSAAGKNVLVTDSVIVARRTRASSITGNVGPAVVKELELLMKWHPMGSPGEMLARLRRLSSVYARGFSRHRDYGYDRQAYPKPSEAGLGALYAPLGVLRVSVGELLWRTVRVLARWLQRRA